MEKDISIQYRIVRKFGGNNVWQIDFYKLFGEEKFGEWFVNQKIIIAQNVACFMRYDKIANNSLCAFVFSLMQSSMQWVSVMTN